MTGPKGSKMGEGMKQGFPYSVVVALTAINEVSGSIPLCEYIKTYLIVLAVIFVFGS